MIIFSIYIYIYILFLAFKHVSQRTPPIHTAWLGRGGGSAGVGGNAPRVFLQEAAAEEKCLV